MTDGTYQNHSRVVTDAGISYTFIIPVHNESGNIVPLLEEVRVAARQLRRPWEAIWIDDGSSDGTARELKFLLASESHVRVLRSERRFGQSAALVAGLNNAKGSIVITLDGDGQNDPADVPRLVNNLFDADMVIGCRVARVEGWERRAFSRLGNWLRRLLTHSNIRDSGCGLKVFRRIAVGPVLHVDGMHRFIVTYAEINGATVKSLVVRHRPRTSGQSKYSIKGRLLYPLLDCIALAWLKRRKLPPGCYNEIVAPWPSCEPQFSNPAVQRVVPYDAQYKSRVSG